MRELPSAKKAKARYILIETSSGFFGGWDTETETQLIFSRSEQVARQEVDRLNAPEPKLPYRKSVIDEVADQAEGGGKVKTKREPAERKPRPPRQRRSPADRLSDPAVLAVFNGVTCLGRLYYKNGSRFCLSGELSKVIGRARNSTTVYKLIMAGWARHLIGGEQWHNDRKGSAVSGASPA
jgi:hypothetical protein